jgi:glyoxylase-like metal-dependent hydrolase (beta-lactamase superfamily II)
VDTGIGDVAKKPDYARVRKVLTIHRRRGQGIKAQLAKHGLTPKDITTVVNTHLHIAHAGNNYLFTDSKFYIAGDEFRFIDKKLSEDPKQTVYIPETYDKITDVTKTKGEYKITDEVRVLPTPGHTPGHQSILVEQDGHTLVYCGDVSPLKENLVERVAMMSYDRGLNLNSMERLLEVERSRWLFCHDAQQLTMRQAFAPK